MMRLISALCLILAVLFAPAASASARVSMDPLHAAAAMSHGTEVPDHHTAPCNNPNMRCSSEEMSACCTLTAQIGHAPLHIARSQPSRVRPERTTAQPPSPSYPPDTPPA